MQPDPYRYAAACIACTIALFSMSCDQPTAPLRPPQFGFAVDGEPVTTEQIAELKSSTGITPNLIVFFMAWPESMDVMRSPRESLQNISAAGAIPVVTWEPFIDRGGHTETVLVAEVLGGKFDAVIDAFANDLREFGGEVWIRFAHEMNFDHYHWGVTADAFNSEAPLVYRDLFRYVVDRVRAAGATNAKWIFCPNAESIPNPDRDPTASWNRASRFYPGDEYVDILGMDGYNWGTTQSLESAGWQSQWQSFEEIFAPLHAELKSLAPNKPIYVFETASATEGGNKAEWIHAALETATQWSLAGICWFQVNKETDWLLQSGLSPEVLQDFAAAINAEQPAGP